jgi:release factor glutamine methyltransferase
MQIRDALKVATKSLINSSTPNLDSRLILSHVTGFSWEELILNYDKELNRNEEFLFCELVKRREKSEPIAYILGKQEFYGLDFFVDKSVLIPRPETELIIDLLKDEIASRANKEKINILELGVGSGAIAVSLAKEIPEVEITATDISIEALKIAKKNILNHRVQNQITLIQSDWYSSLNQKKKYNYIVSNPPYICRSEYNEMSEEARIFEPDIALYADNGGLYCYQRIIQDVHKFLKPEGKLICEMGYSQKKTILSLVEDFGLKIQSVRQDLLKFDRIFMCQI